MAKKRSYKETKELVKKRSAARREEMVETPFKKVSDVQASLQRSLNQTLSKFERAYQNYEEVMNSNVLDTYSKKITPKDYMKNVKQVGTDASTREFYKSRRQWRKDITNMDMYELIKTYNDLANEGYVDDMRYEYLESDDRAYIYAQRLSLFELKEEVNEGLNKKEIVQNKSFLGAVSLPIPD